MKVLAYFIFFTFFLSCTCKNEPIEPTKIIDLNNREVNAITETLFIVSKIEGPDIIDKLAFLKDKDFQFNKNGLIFSNNIEIGRWTNDRWIYLKAIDLRLLINLVSKKEMKVYSNYFDCKTKSIVEESIHLTGNLEIDSDLNNGFDF